MFAFKCCFSAVISVLSKRCDNSFAILDVWTALKRVLLWPHKSQYTSARERNFDRNCCVINETCNYWSVSVIHSSYLCCWPLQAYCRCSWLSVSACHTIPTAVRTPIVTLGSPIIVNFLRDYLRLICSSSPHFWLSILHLVSGLWPINIRIPRYFRQIFLFASTQKAGLWTKASQTVLLMKYKHTQRTETEQRPHSIWKLIIIESLVSKAYIYFWIINKSSFGSLLMRRTLRIKRTNIESHRLIEIRTDRPTKPTKRLTQKGFTDALAMLRARSAFSLLNASQLFQPLMS